MSFAQTSNHIRKVKLFIPNAQSPLLTTYGKFILPKLSPLKQKFEILSQRSEVKKKSNPEPQYMSAQDIDKVNRSYEALKKTKGVDIKKLKQTEYHIDPLYKSIYDLKQNALRSRALSQRRSNLGSSSEMTMSGSLYLTKS